MGESEITKRVYMNMINALGARGRHTVESQDRVLEYVRGRGEGRMRVLEYARREYKDRNKGRDF